MAAVAGAGLGASITYLGGGSGAGEAAMIGGTQLIAPMSRQLNSGTADGVKCTVSATQLLVGLDGIAVVAANQIGGDSLDETSSTADNCSDSISGTPTGGHTITGITKADGTTPCDATDGCTTPGSYTFGSWKEVLQMVYGGMNHAAPAALFAAGGAANSCVYQAPPNEAAADSACTGGQVCYPGNGTSANTGKCGDPTQVGKRNPARVNCLSPVRSALVNTWGNLFTDVGTPHACRSGNCTKLRHAFRRDDLSGTTDAFVSLVGLPTLPNPTAAAVGAPSFVPIPDRQATANAFCNAGERLMNKGDADYLDLDPIRRSVDHLNTSGTRTGLEQVAEILPSFGGNNTDALCNVDRDPVAAGVQPAIPADHGATTEPGVLPDPTIAGSTAALQADLGTNGLGGLLASPYAATTRLCLGLVLPVSVPANYATIQQAYFADATNAVAKCDVLDPPGVGPATAISSVIMDTQHSATALCPNGTNQPCDLPYKVDPSAPGGKNFNCLSDQLNPNPSGIQDRRIFNVHVVDQTGHYLRDNYINSAISGTLSAVRQARVVSGFYRIHTSTTTNLNGSQPTGGPCQLFDSTAQIGCLVKANSCDIGFAGREAADDILTLGSANTHNFALMMEGIRPTTANIQNLALAASPTYPMARGLWLNSIVGRPAIPAADAQAALYDWEAVPANIDPIITAHNFVVVPSSTTRAKSCPASFP